MGEFLEIELLDGGHARVSFWYLASNGPLAPLPPASLPSGACEAPASTSGSSPSLALASRLVGVAVSPSLYGTVSPHSFGYLLLYTRSQLSINTCGLLNESCISPAPAHPLAVLVRAPVLLLQQSQVIDGQEPAPVSVSGGWWGAGQMRSEWQYFLRAETGESITPHRSPRRLGKECLWESVDQGSGWGARDQGTGQGRGWDTRQIPGPSLWAGSSLAGPGVK